MCDSKFQIDDCSYDTHTTMILLYEIDCEIINVSLTFLLTAVLQFVPRRRTESLGNTCMRGMQR
jgi:hypothetical protein